MLVPELEVPELSSRPPYLLLPNPPAHQSCRSIGFGCEILAPMKNYRLMPAEGQGGFFFRWDDGRWVGRRDRAVPWPVSWWLTRRARLAGCSRWWAVSGLLRHLQETLVASVSRVVLLQRLHRAECAARPRAVDISPPEACCGSVVAAQAVCTASEPIKRRKVLRRSSTVRLLTAGRGRAYPLVRRPGGTARPARQQRTSPMWT